MKYYFGLLLLYSVSGTVQASGISPITAPPPVSQPLNGTAPDKIDNDSGNTTVTTRNLTHSGPYPAQQRTKEWHPDAHDAFFWFRHGWLPKDKHIVKEFHWEDFDWHLERGLVWVPPKYLTPDRKLKRDLLETRVGHLLGSRIRSLRPEHSVVDYEIADFFQRNGSAKDGVGKFNHKTFEYWFERGRVHVSSKWRKPIHKRTGDELGGTSVLDLPRMYEWIDNVETESTKVMSTTNTSVLNPGNPVNQAGPLLGQPNDYVKFPFDKDALRPLTLRDFYQLDTNFPDRTGPFQLENFKNAWNNGDVFMEEEFLHGDGKLDIVKVSRVVTGTQGSARGQVFDGDWMQTLPEDSIPPGDTAPDIDYIPETARDTLTRRSTNYPTAYDSRSLYTLTTEASSDSGPLAVDVPLAPDVGDAPDVGNHVLDIYDDVGSPSVLSDIWNERMANMPKTAVQEAAQPIARALAAISEVAGDVAEVVGGVVLVIVPYMVPLIVHVVNKRIEKHCNEHHGGPAGCARFHKETHDLKMEEQADHARESQHRKEHMAELEALKQKHKATLEGITDRAKQWELFQQQAKVEKELQAKHLTEEIAERDANDLRRAAEKAGFDARDVAQYKWEQETKAMYKRLAAYSKKHPHQKRAAAYSRAAGHDAAGIEHYKRWFKEQAEAEA
ncbi:hypothetical protein MBLNU457_7179t1 [Dothideomycetes sp. NU457]